MKGILMTNAQIQNLIECNQPLPAGLTTTGDLYLGSYAHALPAGLLENFRSDIFDVLDHAVGEAEGLLAAIRAGKIDGSTYEGACACLVGTLEKSGRVNLPHRSDRMAEQWFMGIRKGNTPADNVPARYAEKWVAEWIRDRGVTSI